ncbi:hypothetical protein K439DRAFT_1621588 [Ramaria rubella]|nr:hypothetical protein K439DRAFT_1621588 [Ramaria rubella]
MGGIIGALLKTDTVTLLLMDFGTPDTPHVDWEHRMGLFQVVKAKPLDPPVVVGPMLQKVSETKLKTIEHCMLGAEKMKLSNLYPLGTIDYVGYKGITWSKAHAGVVSLTHLGKWAEEQGVYICNWAKAQESSMTLLGALESMIHRKKPDA